MSVTRNFRRKIRCAVVVAAAAVLVPAQFAPAVVTIRDNATVTPTAAQVGTTLGDSLTMGTNGRLVINGKSSDTTTTYTGTFLAGGSPNRGTANLNFVTNAASTTTLELSNYGFTTNKTDILVEGRNIGGIGGDTAQVKWTTTTPILFGGSGSVTGVNATILVHDLAAPAATAYNLGTYDLPTGVRGLNTANANDYAVDTFTGSANILLNASQANPSAATFNSLTLRSAGPGVNLSGAAITMPLYANGVGSVLGANGILSDGTAANTISVPTLTANATDGLLVHTVADLTISSNITAGWLTKANAGKLTLTGTNSFNTTNGIESINGGILSVSNDANLGAASNLIVLLGGSLELNATTTFSHPLSVYESDTTLNVIRVTAGNTATFTGGIQLRSGSTGGITYAGPGTSIISGTSAYTATTFITGGTVVANNSAAITSTQISAGANLQINNGVTVSSAGMVITLLASNSKLTVGSTGATGASSGIAGGLTGSTGGTLAYDINGASATDVLNISGTVTAAGTWTINLNDLGGSSLQTGTVYTLMTGGTFTGTPTLVGNVTSSNFALDPAYNGNGLLWDTSSKTLTARFTTVPEPTSAALLGLAGIGLLARRRRKA
jgi:hypothetical protein